MCLCITCCTHLRRLTPQGHGPVHRSGGCATGSARTARPIATSRHLTGPSSPPYISDEPHAIALGLMDSSLAQAVWPSRHDVRARQESPLHALCAHRGAWAHPTSDPLRSQPDPLAQGSTACSALHIRSCPISASVSNTGNGRGTIVCRHGALCDAAHRALCRRRLRVAVTASEASSPFARLKSCRASWIVPTTHSTPIASQILPFCVLFRFGGLTMLPSFRATC